MPPPRRLASTSNWSTFSSVTNGSRMSCWCTLFGKYSSMVRPFNLNWPVPGTSRTRTIASLRRPTVCTGFSAVVTLALLWTRRTRLLRDLGDLERDGLLGGVRVLRTRVHLQLPQHLPAEAVLGEHALDGQLDGALRPLGQQLVVPDTLETTRVAGVAVRDLRLPLVAAEG